MIRKYRQGKLPNLIVIGAQKSATTSLHYYLGLHPQISMSREKELDFFIREINWDKGIGWYKSHFVTHVAVRGEASPNYTNYPRWEDAAETMHSVIPDAKLIYILRDPIDRMVSQYIQFCSDGSEDRTLEDALRPFDNNNVYIRRSRYFMQLQRYLNYFPSSNILVITMEDLRDQRNETLRRVFEFLNVDETFHSPKFVHIKHESAGKRRRKRIGTLMKQFAEVNMAKIFSTDTRMKLGGMLYLPFSSGIERPVLEEGLRRELVGFFREDITRLREHTGDAFEAWCV